MKRSGLRLMGSLLVVLLLSTLVATSAFAAPPIPTPRTPNGGFGYGMMGGAGFGMMGGGFGMMGGWNGLDGVAKLLDTTTADLASQLKDKTLLELAQAKGLSEQQLVDTLIAPYKEQMQRRVSSGYVTQEWADTMLDAMTTSVKASINAKWGTNGSGFGACHGAGAGGMMGGISGTTGGFGGMMGGFGVTRGTLGRW